MSKIKLSALKPSKLKSSSTRKEPSGKEITTISEAMKYLDYRQLFCDKITNNYLNSFPIRMESAKTGTGRQAIINEAEDAITAYSLVVYVLYPNNPTLKKQIDSNKEFSSNFSKMKQWLDERDGEGIARGIMETLGG